MTFLELALEYVQRGWAVIPCYAYGTHRQDCAMSQGGDKCTKKCPKSPLIAGGFHNGTKAPGQVERYWTKWPNANVAIACGASGLAVLDIDHGLKDEAAWRAWCERNGIPETYTVRTGRRPEFGAQMYFAGVMPDVQTFNLDGCSGQVKSAGGYVMAAGSIHPDAGETYQVLCNMPLAPLPDLVRALHTKKEKVETGNAKVPKSKWTLPVHESEDRTGFLLEQTGQLRNLGCGFDAIAAHMRELNDDPEIIADPIDEDRLEQTARNCCKYPVPEPGPEVTIGGKPVGDWREHYHSLEEMQKTPPAAFLIEDFLQQDAITALAAPVAQRKSLIALNVAHALCTKEPLFDYFEVSKQPTRVLYLCPEMGIRSFTARLRSIGLMDRVGKSLFCRTMSAEGTLELSALTAEELSGAVVIIDTAVRYLKGDENSSEHMRAFADEIFRIMRDGAVSVLLLHHSLKGTKESPDLSLENAMRGSGELGAFIASCWATRLQDPSSPYQSASYLANVKQRDFESKPFEVTSGPDCRLHIVGEPGDHVKLSSKAVGAPGNTDGKEDAALQMIRDNPELSQAKLSHKLKEHGITRSPAWIGKKRLEMKYEEMQARG